jgi:hypothetical protein
MLKNDETGVQGSCIVDDIFPVVQDLLDRGKASMDVIVCEIMMVRSIVLSGMTHHLCRKSPLDLTVSR